jgi:hypothetical protein
MRLMIAKPSFANHKRFCGDPATINAFGTWRQLGAVLTSG